MAKWGCPEYAGRCLVLRLLLERARDRYESRPPSEVFQTALADDQSGVS